jgi:hypothetical protein
MQIKHTWTEHVEKGFMSEKFIYRLVLRGALTQPELDVINKYKVMTAWVYSNRQEREDQKVKPSLDADWLQHAAAGWHNGGIEPLLEISLADLLRGVVIKNQNPYYLDAVFNEACKNCENLISNLFDLNGLFSGQENVTEIVTDPNQGS